MLSLSVCHKPGNERINGDASDAADAENTSTLPGEEIATLVPATGEETVKHTKPAVEVGWLVVGSCSLRRRVDCR